MDTVVYLYEHRIDYHQCSDTHGIKENPRDNPESDKEEIIQEFFAPIIWITRIENTLV